MFYPALATFVTGLKLLLIPSYRSTDFEVHRNWLAITHSLPLSRWYLDETSEWTLDYPPLFAWFEWLLSQFATFADSNMLVVSNLEYASDATIIFQRLTVIIMDVVLIWAAYAAARRARTELQGQAVFMALVASAGLLVVDHIHFQYNGFLMGVLLWSVLLVAQGRNVEGAVLFAALLNLKHLFLFSAPLYFVYLLRRHCFGPTTSSALQGLAKLLVLGSAVVAVFVASFGPFVYLQQTTQVLRRLFPFQRGLCHAYWAPNFWALYSAADKVLTSALRASGAEVDVEVGNMAGGIVGVGRFGVLPQVGPGHCALAVLLALTPCLWAVGWQRPAPRRFARALAFSQLCGFVFGYHVHEKAILTVLAPLAVGAFEGPSAPLQLLVLTAAGHYGLLPLIFTPAEYPVALLLLAAQLLALTWALQAPALGSVPAGQNTHGSVRVVAGPPMLVQRVVTAYLLCLVPLELVRVGVLGPTLGSRLPFLPLMAVSLYSAVGVCGTWAWMTAEYLTSTPTASFADD